TGRLPTSPTRRSSDLQLGVFERALGARGHREEAPREFAGIQPISAHVATRIQLGARVANDDHVAGDVRRAGYGVTALMIDDGIDLPEQFAVRRVECRHPSVNGRAEHPAFGIRETATDDAAADFAGDGIV